MFEEIKKKSTPRTHGKKMQTKEKKRITVPTNKVEQRVRPTTNDLENANTVVVDAFLPVVEV